jgi:A/G-specific adenine glycosylase
VDRHAARRLLDWFGSARRDLPWRGPFPRDPYAVLISEVMLQQTQVDRVVDGYRRFVRRFPSLAALAAAAEDDVVGAFAGMGYYGRARRLHRAARAVVERGGWPESARDLAALPGLGPYTSAAVAAFAFGGAKPPVDGNVARIAARVLALPLALGGAPLVRAAAGLAGELHAQRPEPAVYEALMELGATVCTPRSPSCGACPLRPSCAGSAQPEKYPRPRAARATEEQTWVALWLTRDDGSVLLRRVRSGAVLAGLWLPPIVALAAGEAPETAAAALARSLGHRGRLETAPALAHSITHRRIRVLPFVGAWRRAAVGETIEDVAFRDPAAPDLPTSSLLAKLRDACAGRPAGLDRAWTPTPHLE